LVPTGGPPGGLFKWSRKGGSSMGSRKVGPQCVVQEVGSDRGDSPEGAH
jgi:hypothetical protein